MKATSMASSAADEPQLIEWLENETGENACQAEFTARSVAGR